jgi:Ribosomal proteins 50S L24/mitochondrial 39S L24
MFIDEQVREEAYIHASNVMHWSEERQVRSRVGHKWINGRKVRYLKKTGEIVDTEERLQREREEYIAARNARPGDEDEEEGGTGAAAGSIEGDTDASEDETSDESDPESNPGVTGTVASEGEQGKGGKK